MADGIKEFLVELVSLLCGVFGWLSQIADILWMIIRPPRELKSVEGKNVLVVGAGGLGRGLADRLAARGATIFFWDASDALLAEIRQNFQNPNNGSVFTRRVDITDQQAVEAAARELLENHQIDILLNAAGVFHRAESRDEDPKWINRMVDVNLKGVLWTSRAFLPEFYRRRSGHLVTIASLAGLVGCPHVCEYAATKFGVRGYMESLAVEATSRGVPELEFTTLSPGFTLTCMVTEAKWVSEPQTGPPKWDIMTVDECCDQMLTAILSNRRSLILPWRTHLVTAFKSALSERRFTQLLSQQWKHPILQS